MLVYICIRFHLALIGGNLAAQSTWSYRGIGGGNPISEMQLQALLPFSALSPGCPGEVARLIVDR